MLNNKKHVVMSITITKKRFLFWKAFVCLICGIVGWVILKILYPEHYFSLYPCIPVFFFLFGVYYITTFDQFRQYAPKKLLSVYLGMKFVKMVISMMLLFIYILVIKVHKSDFVITFFLFYLMTILFETIFFCLYEQNLKKKMIEKRKNENQ